MAVCALPTAAWKPVIDPEILWQQACKMQRFLLGLWRSFNGG